MLLFLIATVLVSPLLAQSCSNAKITNIKTYSTSDTVLNSATTYVVEFRAQCAGLHTKNLVFYAEIKSKVISSSCDETGEKYQLTWTERNEAAKSGQLDVKIYDEDGITSLKKTQRLQGDANQVKDVTTISFYHAAAYRGPTMPIEFFATILAGIIFYGALTVKNQILA